MIHTLVLTNGMSSEVIKLIEGTFISFQDGTLTLNVDKFSESIDIAEQVKISEILND